ncbi:LPXTG cell wall anchor domain-containing protein [Fictibacillus phosphorivorans]|nr:LPXTG cell wall anchor domain-containing protein [Fictibacillus phosphorivorans]
MSVLAAGNESSTSETTLLNALEIDPTVTAFSDFTVSESMRKLSGSILLNGNVPDAQKKMRPVYKFKLINHTENTLSGLTVTIPYPPHTQLDTTYPPEVLITETNKNRNKEDIIANYDTTTGITLTLPDMESDEILTFDVKFFLLPTDEVEQPSADLTKVTMKSEAVMLESLKNHVKLKLMLKMNNMNSMILEDTVLKVKLPARDLISDVSVTGIEGATVSVKEDYAYIHLPKCMTGESNIILQFTMKKINGWENIQLPLMIGMNGVKDVSLTPITFLLKDVPEFDWKMVKVKGSYFAEMKKGKLFLDYLLQVENQNETSANSYKLRLLLPETVKIENLNISGIKGATIQKDKEGIVWIMVPTLETGTSKVNVRITGAYSGTSDSISTGIMTQGADGVTSTLSTEIKGKTSTDEETPVVISDVEKPINASGPPHQTLPKTGSPFGQSTWTMLGTLLLLLGIGLYFKAVRMEP